MPSTSSKSRKAASYNNPDYRHGPAVDEVECLLHATLDELGGLVDWTFSSSKDITEQGGEKFALSIQDKVCNS